MAAQGQHHVIVVQNRLRHAFALFKSSISGTLGGMSTTWEGVFCALWTPTDQHGQLQDDALLSNLSFLKSGGLQGLLALGSTGEFLFLEPEFRTRLIAKVAELARPLRLMINISDVRPGVVTALARAARDAGADAVSLLPPYFYPVSQEDQLEFFLRAAEAAKLPLFLYNFPERTGNRIALETVAAVADRVPLAGIKQSGDEFEYHAQLVALAREKRFVVLTGADTRLHDAMKMGVSGCVSGLSNAVPELVRQSFEDARAGVGGASAAGARLAEIGKRIGRVCFPLDVAALMEARGLPIGSPKSLISAETKAIYRGLVAELRELLGAWKLV